jgi:hypothetical protein
VRFLIGKALIGLLMFDVLRLGRNFPRLLGALRKWIVRPKQVPAGLIDEVCEAVNHACVWYPKRVLCLQRSAVTTCLLRSFGVPANMVLGTQILPFKAHAWTEVNGVAVNERRDVQSTYLVWQRC